MIQQRGPPGWSKESIEQYVEQLRAWNEENTAELLYAKFGLVMELLEKTDHN